MLYVSARGLCLCQGAARLAAEQHVAMLRLKGLREPLDQVLPRGAGHAPAQKPLHHLRKLERSLKNDTLPM